MAGGSQLSLTWPAGLPVTAVSGLSVTRSCWLTPPALEAPLPLTHPRCCSPQSSCCFLRLDVLPPGGFSPPLSLWPDAAFSGRPRPALPPASPTLPLGPLGQGLGAALPCRRAAQRWGRRGAWWRPSLPRVGDMSTHGECDPLSPHCCA